MNGEHEEMESAPRRVLFAVRMPAELHAELELLARIDGRSIEQFALLALEQYVHGRARDLAVYQALRREQKG